ncbi:MAG: RNA polymerase subunit sigma-70, partial [Paraprevotella sp.]|nr:RNA polymerase subunit sigma-70 [Paraprevotella sp.]
MKEISFRNDILPLKDKLYRLALRITFDTAEAEDIVQDTLIKVWDKRETWAELSSIEAYCLTICRNLALDRSQKKEAQHVELDETRHSRPDNNTPYD